MDKFLSLILITLFLFSCNTDTNQSCNQILDKMEIKHLVDHFSILADSKDVIAQMELFTDTAVVETYRKGKLSSRLKGKKEISTAFDNFLSLFETVYHLNGQQTVKLDGNLATGKAYCLVVLIKKEENGFAKTTYGITYDDTFIKNNDKWLINHRKSNFLWESVEFLKQY